MDNIRALKSAHFYVKLAWVQSWNNVHGRRKWYNFNLLQWSVILKYVFVLNNHRFTFCELWCVKSVQISFFWSVFSCIQFECRKIWTRKNSVFGHFSRRALLTFAEQGSVLPHSDFFPFWLQMSEMTSNHIRVNFLEIWRKCLLDHKEKSNLDSLGAVVTGPPVNLLNMVKYIFLTNFKYRNSSSYPSVRFQ